MSASITPDESGQRLTLKFEGLPEDQGLVRLSALIQQLHKVIRTLRRLERRGGQEAQYRIVGMHIGSAVLELEAIPETISEDEAEEVFGSFRKGTAALATGQLHQLGFAPDVERAFEALKTPLGQSLVGFSVITGGEVAEVRSTDVPLLTPQRVEETHAMGSFSGHIDAINVHGEPLFYLYPPAGPKRIQCVFDRTLLETVRGALKRYCTVTGILKYEKGSPFPRRMDVEKIEVHPQESELPSLMSYFGAFPNLTGGVDPVTYVRRQRDDG